VDGPLQDRWSGLSGLQGGTRSLPSITAEQEDVIFDWLLRVPSEFGFRTGVWTAGLVGQLILKKFGVRYSPSYLREWLSERGYAPRKPVRRAQ